MASPLSRLTEGVLARRGLRVQKIPSAQTIAATHPDLEPAFAAACARCEGQTMTSIERMYALWQAVRHVESAGIAGDLVECGVWRGGSAMLAAITLLELGDTERVLHLYDTFAGMSEPTERDRDPSGASMADEWQTHAGRVDDPVFAYGALSVVQANMRSTGWPEDRVRYLEGKVEDTIPAHLPERVALLRLDTDWYESTRHELEHLWDLLTPGGVLIVDDYGHWAGARQAVDEFFAARDDAPLLTRIDYTGRIGVKPR